MSKNDRINVLVIHADQHRADCLGAYGNSDIKTPAIDALADDGVLFKNNFCTLPVCTPSRYSLITGLYVHQHGGWSNHCTLPHGMATFPKVLRREGFKTKCVGKMHYTPTYSDVGFDEMLIAEQVGPGRFDDDYHRWLKDQGLVDGQDIVDQTGEIRRHAYAEYRENHGTTVSDLDEEHYSTTWIGDRAVEEVESWTDGGHCMMVGFIKPHHPHDAPEPWASMYDPSDLQMLPGWTEDVLERDYAGHKGYFDHKSLDEDKVKTVMAKYYASISQIDHHVARMVETLRRTGQYDNTMILYTSDHGDYMGFHHMCLKGNYMYDPLSRVPCIIKYPESRDAGIVSDGLTSVIDLAPTILQEAGCEIPRVMSGQQMSPAFSRDVVFCEQGGGSSYMVRTRTRKLLLRKDEGRSVLLDLERDPFELDNVIDDPSYEDDLADLKQRLFNWLAFESNTPVHVDEDGALAPWTNARTWNDGHRDEMKDYLHTGAMAYIEEMKKKESSSK